VATRRGWFGRVDRLALSLDQGCIRETKGFVMLIRVLTMRVVPERRDDWLRFTRDIGFPGMRQQPGCHGVWRLHGHDADSEYQVVTLWDSMADLEQFRSSDAMRELTAAAAGLTVPPNAEALFDVIED
jgi:quinol monooxygenase YgiN